MQTYDTRRARNAVNTADESIPGSGDLASAAAPAIGAAYSSGRRIDLPSAMREKMEGAFGMDLSSVRLYESDSVADAGAYAMAQGNRIAFAPGMADFSGSAGQALLGHELSHIASQARGESRGSGLLDSPALEAKADREGAMAAAGKTIYGAGEASAAPVASQSAPIQAARARTRTAQNPGQAQAEAQQNGPARPVASRGRRFRAAAGKAAHGTWGNFKRNWLKYGTGTYALGSDIDSLLTSKYKDKNGNVHGPMVNIDDETNRKKNGVKGAAAAGLGLLGFAQSGIGLGKSVYHGSVSGKITNSLDAIAALGDTANGTLAAIDQFGPSKGKNEDIHKAQSILGIASGGLKTVSGAITGISSGCSQYKINQDAESGLTFSRDNGKNAEMKKAFAQAGRNARVSKYSGITKAIGSGLKTAGTAINAFLPGTTGFILGKSSSILGDAVNLFNTWNTDRMKRKARKDTLNDTFAGLEDSIKNEYDLGLAVNGDQSTGDVRRLAKHNVLRGLIDDVNNEHLFTADDLNALRQKDKLKRKDIYQALSRKRASLISESAESPEEADHDAAQNTKNAMSHMGVHVGGERGRKGVLAKLLG